MSEDTRGLPVARPDADDPARTIMTTPVVDVASDASVREAAARLAEAGDGAALVVRAGSAVGMLSERDVVRALAEGGDPDTVTVADVMTAPVLWVRADDSISSVAELMEMAGVRHAPVRESGAAVGMVSVRDVLDVLM